MIFRCATCNLFDYPTLSATDDTVITIDNLPGFPFEDNSNVEEYSPIFDLLNPEGSHSIGLLFCALDPALTLQSSSEATRIESLDNEAECLANPFAPTNPPLPVDKLTVEDYEGIQIILMGLEELLDKGAFETLTELYIEDFFNSLSDMGVSNVESEVTVTDVLPSDARRRRLETSNVTVVFDMTLTYSATEDPVERSELANAPFSTDEQRAKYVQALLDSEEVPFQNLLGVSELEVPEGVPSTAFLSKIMCSGLLCFLCTMLI
jgi:hypothetical protein